MSFQHGEVFVTDDGAETDLDLDTMKDFLVFQQKKLTILLPEKFIMYFQKKKRKISENCSSYSTYNRPH